MYPHSKQLLGVGKVKKMSALTVEGLQLEARKHHPPTHTHTNTPHPEKKYLPLVVFLMEVFTLGRCVCARSDVIFCVCDLKPKENGGGEGGGIRTLTFFFSMAIWVWEITE